MWRAGDSGPGAVPTGAYGSNLSFPFLCGDLFPGQRWAVGCWSVSSFVNARESALRIRGAETGEPPRGGLSREERAYSGHLSPALLWGSRALMDG